MALRSISKQEFIESMKSIIGRTPIEKLNLLFTSYDLDGNGRVSMDELRHVIKCCMEENGLCFSESDLDLLTQTLFADAELDESNELSFESFVNLLGKTPGLLENVAVSLDQWVMRDDTKGGPPHKTCFGRKLTVSYVKNNLVSFTFFLAFIFINLGLIAGRFYTYREYSYYARIAKSCGQCLNFTCSFTAFLMLRKTITKLRSWGWSSYLPLDQSIYYHKVIGYFITFYAIFHGVFHAFHFRDISTRTGVSLTQYLFTVRENTWPRQISPVTGWILVGILLIMVLTSLPVMRRTGNFEVFYYFHQFYILFYIVLIFHAPKFWYWFALPGTFYCIEMIVRILRSFGSHGYTYIAQGTLLPSRVVHLVIKRPPNFNFSPGDFVYIQIPDVAKTEWHPFTISSAPEMSDYLWLHIRAVGEWTNRVYDYFLEMERQMSKSSVDVCNNLTGDPSSPQTNKLKRGRSYPPLGRANSVQFISPIVDASDEHKGESCYRPTGRAHCPNKPAWQMTRKNQRQAHFASNDGNCLNSNNYNTPSPNLATLDENGNSGGGNIEMRSLGKMVSTPLPHGPAAHPPFSRTFSTVETRVRIPFDRRQSKIYVLPRPADCDDSGVRRKRATCSRKELSKGSEAANCSNLGNGKEVRVNLPDETNHFLRANSQISSGDPQHMSGRIIKLEKPLHLHIDGPFGSPSSHIFRTEHAVLIATGIGVTPFASILQSIMFRYMKAKHTCPSCGHSWSDSIPPNTMNLRKVDFVWINRHQKSFEWFVSLLSELEITQAMVNESDRFLDIHTYITSALDNKTDMKSIGLRLALDLMHEKEKRDLITGLKTRTNPGRPDWHSLFTELSNQKKGRVTVFFCGPPALGRIVQSHCIPFGFAFKKENF